MTQRAQRCRNLGKPQTVRNCSIEERTVRGIEITTKAAKVNDAKPVPLMLGTHHAREWPSSEHACDLLENYRTDWRRRCRPSDRTCRR